jgi:mono/diheme cytochrome c family protein
MALATNRHGEVQPTTADWNPGATGAGWSRRRPSPSPEEITMPTFTTLALCRSALFVSAISLAAAGAAAEGITLPPDSSKLRPSTLPGYALAQQKCGICHSADYISHQPPDVDQVHWTAEMGKMQHSYGAPLDRDEIALIGAYLAVAYGSAKPSDASVTSLTASWEAVKRRETRSIRVTAAPPMCRSGCRPTPVLVATPCRRPSSARRKAPLPQDTAARPPHPPCSPAQSDKAASANRARWPCRRCLILATIRSRRWQHLH